MTVGTTLDTQKLKKLSKYVFVPQKSSWVISIINTLVYLVHVACIGLI